MNSSTTALDLGIDGMDCASCAGRVQRALARVPGVTAASVNVAAGSARVELAAAPPPGALAAAVTAAGFAPRLERRELAVEGATCASCAARIERALAAVPGVEAAAVNLATGRATVASLAGAVPADRLLAAIEAAGYGARAALPGPVAAAADGDGRTALRRFAVAAALTLPIAVIEMGGHVSEGPRHALAAAFGGDVLRLASLLLATLVLFGPGRGFFAKGARSLRRGDPDMNALVMLGAGAAWLYSGVVSLRPGLVPASGGHVYFESAALIVTLVLLGRSLEARARGRAGAAIGRLLALAPPTANRLAEGREETVPVAAVVPGDLLRVRPGGRVPVDGTLVEGSSWIDESMVTGESVPVAKAVGATAIGGTLNGSGAFTLRADRVGGDTVLARIARLVAEAQGDKLPIQALADRVTGWFVPAVIAVAAATCAAWLAADAAPGTALVHAVAVLIVACPCAMGLATPTSILVGSGRAAELGVLFRRGAALQALAAVRTVAFDKTGTLTRGRPEVAGIAPQPGFGREGLLALAAAVEARSEHPLAEAIVRAARASAPAPSAARGFVADPGLGAAADVDGRRVVVGNALHLAAAGIDAAPLAAAAAGYAEAAGTPVMVAVDGRAAGVIAVSDRIRPETGAALAALRRQGLGVAMVTGDVAAAAGAVSRQLGIDRVEAGVRPGGKVEAVRRLGPGVAFVGDGVNDAPALAAADVGLAVGTGTDAAIEAADVVLMSGDPRRVADAVTVSRATMANIRQNLFWAFAYNVALIPVAAGVLVPIWGIGLSPALAAAAMALSSVCVLGNALRLRRLCPETA